LSDRPGGCEILTGFPYWREPSREGLVTSMMEVKSDYGWATDRVRTVGRANVCHQFSWKMVAKIVKREIEHAIATDGCQYDG
jgi:hypothetical protein